MQEDFNEPTTSRADTMSNIFVSKHPLVSHKLSLLRCKTQNSKQVRELIDEIGTLLIYEATADLPLVSQGKVSSQH